MKKLLLGSSMLAAVAFAASAQADTPKITVGGVIDWQVGVMSDDGDANQRNHAFKNDTEINFNVDGKADNGLGYGAVIVLEADVTNDADTQGTNAAETYVYLDGSWGRVQLGSTTGASGALEVDAASIARATGGIDGAWTYYANNLGTTNYIATPDLPLAYGIHNGGYGNEAQENTNKVTYYTPRFSGFQLGVSYAPDDVNSGQGSIVGGPNRADNRAVTNGLSRAENIWSGGVNYEGTFDQVGVAAAVTAEHGSAETAGYNDLFGWNAGAKLSYMGFSAAGSYGKWDDSLTLKTSNLDGSDYWTLGGAYEMGPYGVSVTYLNSSLDTTAAADNDFENLSIGADYKLAPGLTPYAEVSFYEADTNGTTNDNDGHVFLLGTMLNF
jgi:predicted porin